MKINLKNKIVLITGASSGIGKAMAKQFAISGATVAIHYNSNIDAASELANELGNNSKIFQANLSQTHDAQKLFNEVVKEFGQLDVLINNAGIFDYSPISENDWLGKWQKTIDTNLSSAAILCKLAIKHFLANDGGRIINITSRAAHRGDTADYMAYAASKGGLLALTRTIARAYGKNNIKAFSIAPGFVHTPMAEEFINKHGKQKIIDELSLSELTLPEDIAPTAVFLASGLMDHATGCTIDINGGSYVR